MQTATFKKISSPEDIHELVIGDQILDHPEPGKAKTYTVSNISNGIVYAIHEDGITDLRVFPQDETLIANWWLVR
jgi:hypothetical protein